MKYKSFFFWLLTLIVFNSNAQGKLSFASEKNLKKLKKSTLQVVTGQISDDYDAAIKDILDKYWTICPLTYVDKGSIDKDLPRLETISYHINSGGGHDYTKLMFNGPGMMAWVCYFDNVSNKKQQFGIDLTDADCAAHATIALKNLCYHIKALDEANAQGTKAPDPFDGDAGMLKKVTVLIPQEYIGKELTKNAFRKIPKKEFLPLSEINKRIREDANNSGLAVLYAYNSYESGKLFFIVDMESGKFIIADVFGEFAAVNVDAVYKKITDKEIIKSIDDKLK